MTELLIKEYLRKAPKSAEVRIIARARTLANLGILDGKRKGALARFLQEAKLISNGDPIIDLQNYCKTKVINSGGIYWLDFILSK